MSTRSGRDFYHTNDVNAREALGALFEGVDSTYGQPAIFRYVQHLGAVAVVSGHCATKVTDITTVSNDYDIAGALNVPAGAYISVPTQNYYTYIMVYGYPPTLLGDGSVAKGDGIMWKGVDGTWDTSVGTTYVAGECWADDTGSPAVFPGMIRCL